MESEMFMWPASVSPPGVRTRSTQFQRTRSTHFQSVSDVFAAKLAGSGTLLWNTFLGSDSYDFGQGIAVDGNGNVLVVGYSQGDWGGTPVLPFTPGGEGITDAFVASLSYDLLTISGRITFGGTGLADVVLGGLPGNPVTDGNGNYTATVPSGSSWTVTPARIGYTFDPASRNYPSVGENHENDDYLASSVTTATISGTVRIDGGTQLYRGGHKRFAARDPTLSPTHQDSTGPKSIRVGTGIVTPSKAGYTFVPSSRRTYNDVQDPPSHR